MGTFPARAASDRAMGTKRVLRILCAALALAVLPVTSAKACSCGPLDPRDALASSDGAFIGTFVESHLAEEPDPTDPFTSDADTIYTFTLDESYKGELGQPGDVVEVHSAYTGASCGLEVQPGEKYGLFLSVRSGDGAWSSNLCRQVSPETMRTAASPLPAPTGEGPARMLVGGGFGKAQLMALDSRGRTLAYGFGDREVYHADVCPDSKRSVEIAQTYPEPPVLVIRELPSLDTVKRIELPYGRGQTFPRQSAAGVSCRTTFARRAVIFSTNYNEPRALGMLLAVRGQEATVLYEGSARAAVFGDRAAFLSAGDWGRQLVKVSLRTGRDRRLASLPGRYQLSLSLSPDGERIAGIAMPPWDDMDSQPTRFYTVRVTGRPARVRTRSLGTGEMYGHTGWMTSRRPVAFMEGPGRSRVFDLRLRAVSRFGQWPARPPVILGRVAFAPGYGGYESAALYKVRLPRGEVRIRRTLPSPLAYTIVEVP